MDQQHHRHGGVGLAVAIAVTARRQREVGGQGKPVAALQLQRVHWLQRRAFQLGPGDVKLGERARLAVEEVGLGGGDDGIVADDPLRVVLGPRGNPELAFEIVFEKLQRLLDLGIERGPLVLEIVDRIGLDLAGFLVADRAADIGTLVLSDHARLARLDIHRDQRGGVAAAAVEPVERLAVGREPGRAGGERIFEPGAAEGLFFHDIVRHAEEIHAAFRIGPQREPHVEIVVGDEARVALVLDQHRQLARVEIEHVDVVILRIAVVEADEDLVLDPVRSADELDARILEIGQRRLGAGFQVHAVEQEVLVPALVLDVEQALAVGRPEILADRAVACLGHDLRIVEIVGRSHPDVEHAVRRREPGNPFAIGADLACGFGRIAEQRFARDQGCRSGGIVCGHAGVRLCGRILCDRRHGG